MGAPFCCRSATAQGGIELVDVPVPSAARALRPLSPLHGDVCAAADGAIEAHRVRRSRASNGWRGQVDPPGEGRELWQTMLVPLMPGLGPWDCTGSQLVLDAALLAAIPAGSALSVQQVGDFRLSPPPLMGRWQPCPKSLTRAIAGSWMEPRPVHGPARRVGWRSGPRADGELSRPCPGCVSDGSATVPRYVSAAPNGLYPLLLRIPMGARRSTWKRVRQ